MGHAELVSCFTDIRSCIFTAKIGDSQGIFAGYCASIFGKRVVIQPMPAEAWCGIAAGLAFKRSVTVF